MQLFLSCIVIIMLSVSASTCWSCWSTAFVLPFEGTPLHFFFFLDCFGITFHPPSSGVSTFLGLAAKKWAPSILPHMNLNPVSSECCQTFWGKKMFRLDLAKHLRARRSIAESVQFILYGDWKSFHFMCEIYPPPQPPNPPVCSKCQATGWDKQDAELARAWLGTYFIYISKKFSALSCHFNYFTFLIILSVIRKDYFICFK